MARVRQLDPDPSALTAARIAARRLATATTMATDGSAATLLARYAAIEGIRVGTGASWEVVCATALRALVAQDLADATLRVCDPAGFRLVCAECELAERAGPDEAEAAEQALLAYRAEALRDGGTDVALRALHGAPPDEALTDAVLLLARARILERALDRRAAVRARALLAANLPDSGQSWYAGVDAPARLAGHFQDAIRSIDRALAVDERARPRSVRRLRAAVQSEALEWLAADVSVAEMLATRIAAVADDAASPFCA